MFIQTVWPDHSTGFINLISRMHGHLRACRNWVCFERCGDWKHTIASWRAPFSFRQISKQYIIKFAPWMIFAWLNRPLAHWAPNNILLPLTKPLQFSQLWYLHHFLFFLSPGLLTLVWTTTNFVLPLIRLLPPSDHLNSPHSPPPLSPSHPDFGPVNTLIQDARLAGWLHNNGYNAKGCLRVWGWGNGGAACSCLGFHAVAHVSYLEI